MSYKESLINQIERDIRLIAKECCVNTEVLSLDDLKKGMIVELEHGLHHLSGTREARRINGLINVTDDDLYLTCRIVLAHFTEGLNYYHYLEEMEKKLEADRKGAPYVNVFCNSSPRNSDDDGCNVL